MKKRLMWLLPLVAICALVSCGNNTQSNSNNTTTEASKEYCKVTEISVEGDLVKHDNVKLSSLTRYNRFVEKSEETTTEANEDNPITYSVLNNTDNFDISIRVDNPTDNSIAQLKFEVEGKVWIKNEKGEMAPFEDYNHGIVNWTAQNASKETFTFKTEKDAIVKIVGIKLVGETTWQTDNLGYNQLNIYKVDDIVQFESNKYNVGYTFKTKSVDNVTVRLVSNGTTEIAPENSTYTMHDDGTIYVEYWYQISESIKVFCIQKKDIKVVDISIGDITNSYDDAAHTQWLIRVVIDVNNVGTGNAADKEFTFELTDGNTNYPLIELTDYYYAVIPATVNPSDLSVEVK